MAITSQRQRIANRDSRRRVPPAAGGTRALINSRRAAQAAITAGGAPLVRRVMRGRGVGLDRGG